MSGLNQVTIVGRLGRDPESRTTQNGKAVCNLSVATSEMAGGEERTEWHRVVVWEKQAESCAKYLSKGREVAITGRLRTSSYEKNGEKRYSTEIVAHRVVFLGSKNESTKPPVDTSGYVQGDDDIPF